MLDATINSLNWAIRFNIATGVLNLLSIGMLCYSAWLFRKAARIYRDAASHFTP